MAEQLFIDGTFPRDNAVEALEAELVADIEYAKQALAQDITQRSNYDLHLLPETQNKMRTG